MPMTMKRIVSLTSYMPLISLDPRQLAPARYRGRRGSRGFTRVSYFIFCARACVCGGEEEEEEIKQCTAAFTVENIYFRWAAVSFVVFIPFSFCCRATEGNPALTVTEEDPRLWVSQW